MQVRCNNYSNLQVPGVMTRFFFLSLEQQHHAGCGCNNEIVVRGNNVVLVWQAVLSVLVTFSRYHVCLFCLVRCISNVEFSTSNMHIPLPRGVDD